MNTRSVRDDTGQQVSRDKLPLRRLATTFQSLVTDQKSCTVNEAVWKGKTLPESDLRGRALADLLFLDTSTVSVPPLHTLPLSGYTLLQYYDTASYHTRDHVNSS